MKVNILSKKEIIYVVLIAIINFILLSTIFQYFRIYDVIPNTILVLLVSITMITNRKYGFVFAITSGILCDVFLSRVLVINLIIYLVIVFFLSLFEESLFEGNFVTPIFMIGISTAIYYSIYFILMFLLNSLIPIELIIDKLLVEVIYNCVIGMFVYFYMYRKVNGHDSW